jgi:hypothetical protein
MSQTNSCKTGVNTRTEVLKGLAAGTIGGLVASWVMEEFQYAWEKVSKHMKHELRVMLAQGSGSIVNFGVC